MTIIAAFFAGFVFACAAVWLGYRMGFEAKTGTLPDVHEAPREYGGKELDSAEGQFMGAVYGEGE